MADQIETQCVANWLTANLAGLWAILIIFPLMMYWFSTYGFDYWRKKGIITPPILPFIGNLFTPFRPMPILQMDYLKKYGKFFGLYRGRRPMLCIADPDVIKRIMATDFPVFRNRIYKQPRHKILGQNLVEIRDEKWKRVRSILSSLFTTSKLKKMEPLMTQCTDSLMKALDGMAERKESFLAYGVMGNYSMDVIAKCAFATETNAHNENENIFVQEARKVFKFQLFLVLMEMALPESVIVWLTKQRVWGFHNKSMDFFLNIGSSLIKQRKSNRSKHVDDMLQLMMDARHGKDVKFEKEDEFESHHVNAGQEERESEQSELRHIVGSKFLTEEEILSQCIVFFLAGYENTASTLANCLYELATHPDVQEKLYREIKTMLDQGGQLDYANVMCLPYLDAVLSETFRILPPAIELSREAAEKYYINEYNYTMEPGEGVVIPIYAMHHNPEYFPDPERFDPERFMPENRHRIIPYTYLPFGGGPRNCIGMRFVLAESKLCLARVVHRFNIIRTERTPDNLEVQNHIALLKMTPIYVGVSRRTD